MEDRAEAKVSQASVHLRQALADSDKYCGDCDMFIPPHGCTHVLSGPREIASRLVCDDWAAK